MSTILEKGQSYVLSDSHFDLSAITVGLGWDPREPKADRGLLQKLFAASEASPFDLDAIAFMLDKHDKVGNLGYSKDMGKGKLAHLVNSDIIYYNNLRHPGGAVYHTGDNLTGEGSGDDEQIIVRVQALHPKFHKILFLATIYEGQRRRQHFGMVQNAFIRAIDAQGREMVRYNLSNEEAYQSKCSMLFGEVFRDGHQWQFRALGNGLETDAFSRILEDYVYTPGN